MLEIDQLAKIKVIGVGGGFFAELVLNDLFNVRRLDVALVGVSKHRTALEFDSYVKSYRKGQNDEQRNKRT